MMLAGIDLDEIADTLGLSAAGLESYLCAMLRRLEAQHAVHPINYTNRRNAA
jgi:DNA-binding CsgD family transcriptional regulator